MPCVNEDVVIVGIGETPVGKLPGMSPVEIQAMAVLEALKPPPGEGLALAFGPGLSIELAQLRRLSG